MERNLMKGNEALAEAAIRAGCKCFFGYPITPQTEISAYMAKRMPKVGGVFLQAESEIAAINMVYGCASSGVRCMTSSSSPGISLKSEGVSYMAGSDLPCVIVNVMRGGPGLGGIQPSQSDYWQATRALGHGDFQILVFAPSTVQEMADLMGRAFDEADKYRMPAMILADGLLGQMMEPVTFKVGRDTAPRRFREAMGNKRGTATKRRHNIVNSLYLQAEELERLNIERFERYEIVKKELHEAELYKTEDADIVVAAYGSVARLAKAAVDRAREAGIKAGLVRPVTLWPFPVQEVPRSVPECKTRSVRGDVDGSDDRRRKTRAGLPNSRGVLRRTGGVVPKPTAIFEQIKLLSEKEAE